MTEDLSRLFNNPQFSDIVIICTYEGQENKIYLHKVIVGIRFGTLLEFFDKYNEFRSKDVPYQHLLAICKWVYTGIFQVTQDMEELKKSIIKLNAYPLLPKLTQENIGKEVKSNDPHFDMIFNQSALSDLTLSVQGKDIFAHRALIAARSEYFRIMLSKDFKEKSKDTITIPDISHQALLNILQYLYTDSCSLDLENCSELLTFADMYQIPRLFSIVVIFILEKTELENLIDVYHLHLQFPEKTNALLQKVRYLMGYFSSHIVNSKEFLQLPETEQMDLRAMIIPGDWKMPVGDIPSKDKKNCLLQ